MDKLVVGVDEACKALSMSRTVLLEKTYAGVIPSFKVGRRRCYSTEELLKWVKAQACAADEGAP
jgi:excisionase family DNA binding protein